MGCGCNSSPFREEVERTILSYINRLKLTKNNKNILIYEIQKDLEKRSICVEKYNYPYREDDVEKTVKIYKNYITRKFNGNVNFIEEKNKVVIKEKEEPENQKKDINNKLKLKEKNNNENIDDNDKINKYKEKLINEEAQNDKKIIGTKGNNKESKEFENSNNVNQELHPILEEKLNNYSEKDESIEENENSVKNNTILLFSHLLFKNFLKQLYMYSYTFY